MQDTQRMRCSFLNCNHGRCHEACTILPSVQATQPTWPPHVTSHPHSTLFHRNRIPAIFATLGSSAASYDATTTAVCTTTDPAGSPSPGYHHLLELLWRSTAIPALRRLVRILHLPPARPYQPLQTCHPLHHSHNLADHTLQAVHDYKQARDQSYKSYPS